MLKHILFSLLFISMSYSQTENTVALQNEKGKIFLFGEAHFVNEKYDEMKAFILSSFKTKLNNEMDSLLQKRHIPKNSAIRTTLLNYVNELALISTDPYELETLKVLQVSLLIDCTICRKRDRFLYDRFKKYYDPTDAMVFGTFGIDHVINKPDFSKVSEFFKIDHKVDTINHKSLYNFMKDDFNDKIFRVGIIALQQNLRLSDFQKPSDYSYIMNTEERNYIKTLFNDKEVVRLYPYEHEALTNLASNLDYLIVYKSSNYRY